MNSICHICNTASPFLMRKDDYDLYECPKCKLVFVFPQPSSDFLKDKLYSYESGYQANAVGDLSIRKEDLRAKKVLDFFEKINSKSRILDIGSAQGQFMYWAQKRGFQVAGVELNKRTADSAKEQALEVFNGFLADASFEENSFDLIFLGEIIEHVSNPRGFIKDCSKFLKTGGVIAITTPNLDCFWSQSTFILYKIFKMPWSSVTPPYHLHQFSINNLDLLLEQERFSFLHGDFLFMTRLKYELGMMHLLKRFKKSREITDFIFMIFSFSLYFFIYIVNLILHPVLRKDFNMIRFYKKADSM